MPTNTRTIVPSWKDIMDTHRLSGIAEFEKKAKEFFLELKTELQKKYKNSITYSDVIFHGEDSTIASYTAKKGNLAISIKITGGKVFVKSDPISDGIRCISIPGTIEAIDKILSEK